jgi:hypothetical protein
MLAELWGIICRNVIWVKMVLREITMAMYFVGVHIVSSPVTTENYVYESRLLVHL